MFNFIISFLIFTLFDGHFNNIFIVFALIMTFFIIILDIDYHSIIFPLFMEFDNY